MNFGSDQSHPSDEMEDGCARNWAIGSCLIHEMKSNFFPRCHIVASSNAHYWLETQFLSKGPGHSTQGSKIPFISNMKKPACASKQDVLELATLQ